jgi:hypothetical protein
MTDQQLALQAISEANVFSRNTLSRAPTMTSVSLTSRWKFSNGPIWQSLQTDSSDELAFEVRR